MNNHIVIAGNCTFCKGKWYNLSFDEKNDCVDRQETFIYSISSDSSENRGYLQTHVFMFGGICFYCEKSEDLIEYMKEPCIKFLETETSTMDEF